MLRLFSIDVFGRQMIMTTITDTDLKTLKQTGTISIYSPCLLDQQVFCIKSTEWNTDLSVSETLSSDSIPNKRIALTIQSLRFSCF